MAKLILTEKEKTDPSYLDWDDTALGKLVKKTAIKAKDEYGQDAAYCTLASKLLIDSAIRTNAEKLTQDITGLTVEGRDMGDWKITVEQVRKPKETQCS